MNIMWYIVLGLVCYIAVVTLVDFLVAKYKQPKDDYFADSKKSKGGNAHDVDEKKYSL